MKKNLDVVQPEGKIVFFFSLSSTSEIVGIHSALPHIIRAGKVPVRKDKTVTVRDMTKVPA